MITVSVLYANQDGATFDHDYYRDKHIPMVAEKLGPVLRRAVVERGLAGGAPDAPAPYVALGHLSFDSVEDFQQAFAPHAEEIMADVANYTTIVPTFQISEVTSG